MWIVEDYICIRCTIRYTGNGVSRQSRVTQYNKVSCHRLNSRYLVNTLWTCSSASFVKAIRTFCRVYRQFRFQKKSNKPDLNIQFP